MIAFYRETWPTQIQRLKQYFEVNETAQEKRVTVQLHFTGGNTQVPQGPANTRFAQIIAFL